MHSIIFGTEYGFAMRFIKLKKSPWPQSAGELYRPSDRRLGAKLVRTFADREMSRGELDVSIRPYFRFTDQSRYFFFQVPPQLYSRG
jgi:hypothetical protein